MENIILKLNVELICQKWVNVLIAAVQCSWTQYRHILMSYPIFISYLFNDYTHTMLHQFIHASSFQIGLIVEVAYNYIFRVI